MADLVVAILIVGWFLVLVGYLWAVGRLAR
jgi:hypothetical protein